MERKVKYELALKLKCVKLVEGQYRSPSSVSQEYGMNVSQLNRWRENYRELGVKGLITAKNKVYSAEFKLKVIRAIEHLGLSLSEAKFKFNIPEASIIVVWQRKFATFGLDGLLPKRKGRPPKEMNTNKRKPRKTNKPLTREEELLIENEKLRCELAFIKKYNALVQAQEEADAKQKQKSKPSEN
jgi:transposase